MADETVDVRLVGGPPDWAGKTLTYPRSVVYDRPIEEAGAYLISAHPPERGPDEDPAPRAVYAPNNDRTTWHFWGWFPASPSDPPPEAYTTPQET
ncbi:hypothetical protein [Thermomonospora catenispora]|uniref:hypothetical protein n=1 Tax=Thermomonospora catenispora TaxID=2493090 RepID=UPI0011241ECD|nr:hypothetical protein [Thermomonospora catenispora]TNY34547.1 hypothetical protein EIO00_23180 [Thermomonospora catenispora]